MSENVKLRTAKMRHAIQACSCYGVGGGDDCPGAEEIESTAYKFVFGGLKSAEGSNAKQGRRGE